MSPPRGAAAEALWQDYLRSLDDPAAAERWYFGLLRTGDGVDGADTDAVNHGADLIRWGTKTAVCWLLWDLQAAALPLPRAGSLRMVEDGEGDAPCIVEVTEVRTIAFRDVNARLALEDGGERTMSLKTWRLERWAQYSAICERLGREATHDMPLLCERFRVVWPPPEVR